MRWSLALAPTLLAAVSLSAAVAQPTITGPIAATATPGDPSHNYPFGATEANLAAHDYREDEFYVEGLTHAYRNDGQTVMDAIGPFPYKTRIIVRRPKSASRFNGTVIIEMMASSANVDQENDWDWSHEHMMRAGYAYIGVTGRPQGVEGPQGLKAWNPARYGSLDLSAQGQYPGGALAHDIFSQVAQAAKSGNVKLLANLKVKNVIATGHSAGAAILIRYFNLIHPLAGVVDGFVFHGIGQHVRTDLKTPAWKLLSEMDVVQANGEAQPDTPALRTWEVAGAAHADWYLIQVLESLFRRDLGAVPDDKCDRPPMSRTPAYMVQNAVYDWMKRWIEKGTEPPRAPRITLASARVVARDDNGNALGGIRLAPFAVPTAIDTGVNSGTTFCGIMGSHEPFDAVKLARLYPTHAGYVAAIARVANANLKAGYITKDDAAQIRREAAMSTIGAAAR